jgi:CheY-like chemotaxis protein
MSAMLREEQRNKALLVGAIMQVNDFHPGDLFGQIQSLVDQLETERKARAAAEMTGAACSSLLTIVGKELLPPMASLATMADRILSGPLSAAQRREAEALAQSTQRFLGALSEVQDFSNLESGEAELAVERFDLHVMVKEAASVLQERAGAKGLMSGVDMADNCPRFIVGDAVRVRQVLMGLIEMALHSTNAGSIRLYASINEASYPITVRFDVTDTGEGFSPAEHAALFQPSADASRVGGGLGCESAAGQGSLYWFTFQTVVADDMPHAQMAGHEAQVGILEAANDDVPADLKPTPEPRHKSGALSGHVLVVESNVVNRLLIGAYLEEFGLTHEVAETGTAALMCLSARTYDLVLMDTALPDYDGLQMAQRIRALQARSSEVALVALTAVSDEDNGQALVEAGVNARVAKPIQGRGLYAALVPFLPAQDEDVVAKAS